jgi:hypothetical protein
MIAVVCGRGSQVLAQEGVSHGYIPSPAQLPISCTPEPTAQQRRHEGESKSRINCHLDPGPD